MSAGDYQMALLLQKQFEYEANIDNPIQGLTYNNKQNKKPQDKSKSLTDPSWELVDPTPNIHVLFLAFNEKYFWNKLVAVCVDWSKRMTSCAGICSYQGRAGLCKITLSEPLLKLRPRKDLVETLLHEMIHAYLFVTHNNRDRDGHGPEFHRHMYRINSEAGTNITVYHDFHDEVRQYQQHWWRCNGPCQHRKPYFGMVRRATNRAPGPYDRWWAGHSQNCGGTFIKVKEPEKTAKKSSNKENKFIASPKSDLRNFYPVLKGNNPTNPPGTSTPNNIVGFKDLNQLKTKNAVSNSTSTIVINKKSATSKDVPKNSSASGSNLVPKKPSSPVAPFSGTGQALGTQGSVSNPDYAAVRNHWANKFPETSNKALKRPSLESDALEEIKKIKIKDSNRVKCPVCNVQVDESEINAHIDRCLEESAKNDLRKCPICEEQVAVTLFEVHVQFCVNEVFSDASSEGDEDSGLISCLVCDKRIAKTELNVHLDECMSDRVFRDDCEGKNSNTCDDNAAGDSSEGRYNCPVCFKKFAIDLMSDHLNDCLQNNGEDGEIYKSLFEDPF